MKRAILSSLLFVSMIVPCFGQERRKVILDQDGRGPATTDQQSMLLMLQSPKVETLGITIVSGDQWRDEEVAHTLRLLEIIGRTDIPVVPGAAFPLVRTRPEAQAWQQRYGKVAYAGAWDDRWWHESSVIPAMPEGSPTTKPAEEDAAHFLIRMVRKFPHEVTIYEGGPMTNLALAISLDPQFPELAQELRQAYPSLRVLYLSGYPGAAGGANGINESNFLQKPFGMDALCEKVRTLLGETHTNPKR